MGALFVLFVLAPIAASLAFVVVRGSLRAQSPADFAIQILTGLPAIFRSLRRGKRKA